jgi:hypothetical protein
VGPTMGEHFGQPAMQILWLHPDPAQADDFLFLQYVNSYGYPEGASTSLYRHPWSDHDCIGLAAEVEITRASDDGYRVRLIAYSWSVWGDGASPTVFERTQGCAVTVWDSHETFGRFTDAEAYAQFCWGRWRATGSGGSAGLLLRDDLDRMLNPVFQTEAFASR